MNKRGQTALVPRLRFPGFSEEWKGMLFGKAFDFLQANTFSRNQMNTQKGKVRNIHYGDVLIKYGYVLRDISTVPFVNDDVCLDKYNRNSYLQNGDIVIADTAEDLTAGKAVEIQNVNCEILAGLHTMLCRPNEQAAPGYWGYYINSPAYHNSIIPLITGSKVSSISKSSIVNTTVVATDFAEQQKIADCLSSLDDLIIAEDKKLETLKVHKKGLMQKLFPAEGEAVPVWRFPEFRGSGEWEIASLETFIKLYRGSSPRPIQEFLIKKGGVNWIKIGDTKNADGFKIRSVEEQITHEGAQKSRFVTVGELILANSMSYGKTYEVAIDGCIYDGWFVLREYEKYFNKSFLLQQLNSDSMQKQYMALAAGGIVQNISSDIVYSTVLRRPSLEEEQIKIAECLSGIDDLITEQAQKIEALRTHKKGLLQGLFPSIEEVGE